MASIRKVKKQAERQRMRDLAKHRKKLEKQRIAEKEQKAKVFRKEISDALGFKNFKFKRKQLDANYW